MHLIYLRQQTIYIDKDISISMVSGPVPEKVSEYVSSRETVSVEDLARDLNVSRVTARNYLSRLARIGIVKRVGRGLYQRGQGATTSIGLTPDLSIIAEALRKRFPMAEFVIWSMNMLADYTHYAIGKDLIFVEVSPMLSASIRDFLLEQGYRAVLKPEKRDFQEYVYFEKPVFILERKEKYGLISFVPTPERIWLDMYYFLTRKDLSFSPGELGLIFANMLRRDGLNFNRLLRYAQRRKLRNEMIIFLFGLKQSSRWLIPENVLVGRKEALEVIEEMIEGTKE